MSQATEKLLRLVHVIDALIKLLNILIEACEAALDCDQLVTDPGENAIATPLNECNHHTRRQVQYEADASQQNKEEAIVHNLVLH